jgi:site-specific DNA-methyltransferase (adenine-specific)
LKTQLILEKVKQVLDMAKSEIYNLDCLVGMKDTPDRYYDLAICDPPYGIGADKKNAHSSIRDNKKWAEKNWDSEIPKLEYFNELFRVSVNQIIWGGNYFTAHLKPSRCWVFWYKKQNGLSMSDGEMAWTSFNQVARQIAIHRIALW